MPEQEIIRTEIFTVDHVMPDSYGNLTVTDKEGSEHKVNAKHVDLHGVFVPGMAVEVGIANFNKRDYIHTAIQVGDALPNAKTVKLNNSNIMLRFFLFDPIYLER